MILIDACFSGLNGYLISRSIREKLCIDCSCAGHCRLTCGSFKMMDSIVKYEQRKRQQDRRRTLRIPVISNGHCSHLDYYTSTAPTSDHTHAPDPVYSLIMRSFIFMISALWSIEQHVLAPCPSLREAPLQSVCHFQIEEPAQRSPFPYKSERRTAAQRLAKR